MSVVFIRGERTIWMDIMRSVPDIWESMDIIVEHEELLKRAKEVSKDIKIQLGNNPRQESHIIKYLNTKLREYLEEIGIQDTKNQSFGREEFS